MDHQIPDANECHERPISGPNVTAPVLKGADVFKGDTPISSEEMKAVRRKIDIRLMPIMAVTYGIQFYDKTVFNQAALFGILEELNLQEPLNGGALDETRFSYAGMIFYIGYLLGVYPATLLSQRFSAPKVCTLLVLLWGITETLTVACTTFAGIMTQRFFLGFLEAGIGPSFVAICAQWYTPGESSFRVAIWWSSNGVVAMVGPLLTYAVGSIRGSLSGWRNIYLFSGLLTICWSPAIFIIFPDDPLRAKFLTDHERRVALERVHDRNAGIGHRKIKLGQVWETFRDPAIWLMVVCMYGAVATNCITGIFSSIIIQNVGFNNLQSLLLQIPVGFLGVLSGLLPVLIIRRTNDWRFVIVTVLLCLSLTGTSILYAVPHTRTALVLLGYYLNNFYVGTVGIILGSVAANVTGNTKRSTVSSLSFMAYCGASIMGPLIMESENNFASGFLGIVICQCAAILAAPAMLVLYRRRNVIRASLLSSRARDQALEDRTDLEDTTFRYST